MLLRHPQLRPDGLQLSSDLLLLGEHRAILSSWRETPDIDAIRETLPEDVLPQLERIMQRDLPSLDGADLRRALDDCVARIERSRLSQAKRASAAALLEPEVQPDMAEAVAQAAALRTGDADKASELARNLIEDEEMGRRLHRSPTTTQPAAATPGEGN
jgi:hypothetical protein